MSVTDCTQFCSFLVKAVLFHGPSNGYYYGSHIADRISYTLPIAPIADGLLYFYPFQELKAQLSGKGCLPLEGEVVNSAAAQAEQGVSLEVLDALHNSFKGLGHDDLPTLTFAMAITCMNASDQPVPFTALLSARHVRAPTVFVSGDDGLLSSTITSVIDHYQSSAVSGEAPSVFVWMRQLAINQHLPAHRRVRFNLEATAAALAATAQHEGTLLVLEAQGRSLMSLACLLEIFISEIGCGKLNLLCNIVDGKALGSAFRNLDIESANGARKQTRRLIIEHFQTRGFDAQTVNSTIKNALIKSAAEGARLAQASSAGKAAVLTAVEQQADVLHWCLQDYSRAEELYIQVLRGREDLLGSDHLDTLRARAGLASLMHSKGENLTFAEELYQNVLTAYAATPEEVAADRISHIVKSLIALKLDRGDIHGAEQLPGCSFNGPGAIITHNERTELHRRALGKKKTLMGLHQADTLRLVFKLAELLIADIDTRAEAQELLQRALTVCKAKLGPSHASTLSAIHATGHLLEECGDLQGAEDSYSRAMAGRQALLGPYHVDTLSSTAALAGVAQSRGDVTHAEELYQQVLRAFMAKQGPEHAGSIRSVADKLMTVQMDMGDMEAAEELLSSIARDFADRLSQDSSPDSIPDELESMLTTMIHVGFNLYVLTEMKVKFLRRAQQAKEAELGPNHADTLELTFRLAALLNKEDSTQAEALELLQQALEVCEAEYGASHANTLSAVHAMGSLLGERQDLQGAEDMYRRAMDGRQASLGPAHPRTIDSMNGVASALMQKGDADKAMQMLRQVVSAREDVLGKEHADTLESLEMLAKLLAVEGCLEDAEQSFRCIVSRKTSSVGENDVSTLGSALHLAIVLEKKGDEQGAEDTYTRVVRGAKASLGEAHPVTLVSSTRLAQLMLSRGVKLHEALTMAKGVMNSYEATLGPDHTKTLMSAWLVGRVLMALKMWPLAEKYMKQALEGFEAMSDDVTDPTVQTLAVFTSLVLSQQVSDYSSSRRHDEFLIKYKLSTKEDIEKAKQEAEEAVCLAVCQLCCTVM